MLFIVTSLGSATTLGGNATLRFATACAKCHEGQCSERLSFTQQPGAAAAHITQYAGPGDEAFIRALHETLERMKIECRYALPPAVRLLTDIADAQYLQDYRDSWTGGYVVPIGELGAGTFRLTATTESDERMRIEVIDDEFDPWLDQCVAPQDGRIVVDFRLSEPRQLFIRLQPKQNKAITRLRLQSVD